MDRENEQKHENCITSHFDAVLNRFRLFADRFCYCAHFWFGIAGQKCFHASWTRK